MGENHNDLNHNSSPKEEETVNSNNHLGTVVREASNRGREDHSAGNRSPLRAVGSSNPGSAPTTAPLPRLPPTAAATTFSPAPAAPTRPHASRRPARS